MTMAGLHFDFFGQAGGELDEAISEQAFDITVDEANKLYRLRGFIDKLFLYKDTNSALIRDFKSSKVVFKGKELTDNLQDLIYTLAVRKLFPQGWESYRCVHLPLQEAS
jgi:ATP-dependent exoDNAse (exonuclease V) beta subunit